VTPTKDRGVYELRSGPYVGRLGLPSGDWIDFVSRFAFDDVVELIRRSGRLPIRQDTLAAPVGQADALIDVIAAAFVRETARLVAAGLAKGYAKHHFEQPPYPGTIDAKQHLSRFAARPDRLVSLASRLTRDVLVNQALAAALEVLRRVPMSASVSAGVARLALAFREVRRVPISAEAVARIRLTALTKNYSDALALAELILRSQSLAIQETTYAGTSMVFSMPKVWERYVAQRVREAWPDTFEVTSPSASTSPRPGVCPQRPMLSFETATSWWRSTTPSTSGSKRRRRVATCTRWSPTANDLGLMRRSWSIQDLERPARSESETGRSGR
jgi:McrBC 5-methylcytosine restriction system component